MQAINAIQYSPFNKTQLAGVTAGGYGNFDMSLDHFLRCSQLYTTHRAPCDVLKCPCVLDALWYLQSDVLPDSRLQVAVDLGHRDADPPGLF